MDSEIEQLRAACERDLGDPGDWKSTGYPKSLALCIIDALYVTGARHRTVEKVVERYRGHRAGQGGDADTDGAAELLANVEEFGGPQAWASAIGNRRPTSTARNAPLRAAALVQATQALIELGIETAWCAVPGQRSGFTWTYLVLLAQVPDLKVDAAVVRYVKREADAADAADAVPVLRAVADRAGWDLTALHAAIWRFESGRRPELPSTA
ncbi:heme peroxidase superfamily protein [Mycolicibacterium conceptionense]|uniref:Heme peroxidase superfamily protein n=1 Tax=Mycolicibacterium conceptionense TaxID=451644 RepID=A0A0U1DED1_9MYCO|nr:heme peroxidase superfamily protein [Mycolicibacterium conceptionense]